MDTYAPTTEVATNEMTATRSTSDKHSTKDANTTDLGTSLVSESTIEPYTEVSTTLVASECSTLPTEADISTPKHETSTVSDRIYFPSDWREFSAFGAK